MTTQSKQIDLFERRSVFGAIFALALPSVVGQIILVIYNMADAWYVGLVGSDAMIAAVGICTPVFLILSAISNLFGIGGAAVMSRALGQQDPRNARDASRFAIWGCAVGATVYALGVLAFLDPLIDLLGGGDPAVHGYARSYMLVAVIAGAPSTALSTLFSHLVRAEGRSLEASIGVSLGGILNIALDPLFMFVILPPGYETLGAAVATAVSNLAALLFFVVLLVRNRARTIVSAKLPSKRLFSTGIPREVIMTGIPACLMTLCENISYAVLDGLMEAAGIAAQAGLIIAKKVNMLAHSAVRGMTQGVLPLIGYNFASGNRERMRAVTLASGGISLLISLLCMAASLLFGEELVSLFISSPASGSVAYGAAFLRILCLGAPLSALAYSVISFYQAIGESGRSLLLALLRKGILDIPLMFLFYRLSPVYGIVSATPIADAVCCVAALALFTATMRKVMKA